MPEFRLRSWAEQTLYASNDYLITADTIEQAAQKLHEAQQDADDKGAPIEVEGIVRDEGPGRLPGVRPLDPKEIINGDTGIAEIDKDGKKLRDVSYEPTEIGVSPEPMPAAPQNETKRYLVRWEIDIDADTPKEAAERALVIQRDATSIATVFDVIDQAKGDIVKIDLTP